MKRLAVPFIVLLLMLFAGAVLAFFGYIKLPSLLEAPSVETPQAANEPASKPKAGSDESYSVAGGTASFDIARIDPNGTSVFAGRAAPGSQVTITGDGETVGTADVDENGEWTFAGEHKFASAEPKLGLLVKSPAEVKAQKAAAAKVASARAEAKPTAEAGKEHSASSVTSDLLKNLQGMVDEARNEQAAGTSGTAASPAAASPAAESPSTASSTPASPTTASPTPASPKTATLQPAPETITKDSAATSVTTVHLEPTTPAAREDQQRKSIPVPITFVFDEASFTAEGRKAAALLLEYLKLKHFGKITLTGHADERGTQELNMNLSQERLETVANFLRAGGFEGQLELIPKGESEPFTGVDRKEYGQDDLWQLDRRVELVIAR